MRDTHRKKQSLLTAAAIVAAVLLCAAAVCVIPESTARAESAVDTLTIKVGYSGMDLDRYVPAGKWNWAKLFHELPLESRSYSYFQSPGATDHPSTDAISVKEYSAIVCSANGFSIEDLLDYAGLYWNDIYNIGFYVTDHNTIWTSFDKDSLFKTRYYFNNLPAHRKETDDGYDFSDAWNDCEEVRPMLAIEDNWASYTQEFENIGPDFTNMKPGNRFHLMFGQDSPTQQLTKQSAKYIDCLYVTLKGKPAFSPEDVKLSTKKGSHTAKMRTRVDNEAMIRQMKDLLDLQSTNEDVLVIRDIRIERDEDYSDLATVVIDYDIVGKGKASITGGFGGATDPDYQFGTDEVDAGSDPSKEPEKPDKKPSGDKKQKRQKKSQKKTAKESKETKAGLTNETSGTPSSGGGSGSYPGGGTLRRPSGTTARANGSISTEGLSRPSSSKASSAKKVSRPKAAAATPGVFKLSDNLHDKLKGINRVTVAEPPAEEDVTQLKIKDDREDVKKAERLRVLIAALASVAIMGAGAFWEEISFRLRLKNRLVKAGKGE